MRLFTFYSYPGTTLSFRGNQENEYFKKIIADIPKEKILTESDGPFATYLEKSLSPLSISETINELSYVWSTTPNETEDIIENNLRVLAKNNKVKLSV